MSEVRPLKVLVSAFAFSPVKGSEFAIGWDYVRAIAARHKVWVIARSNERAETEKYLSQHPDAMPNVTVHYIPFPSRSFDFPLGEIPYYFTYKHWQWLAYRLGYSLDAEIDFDLIHQITSTGFREPGYLWKIPKPFVWGPIGGLQYFPLRLLNAVPFRPRPFLVLKNLTTVWAMHVSRRPKHAAAAAQAILAGSSNVAEKVHSLWGREATVSCEVSAPDLQLGLPTHRAPDEPLHIVWSGSCQPRKALNIVLLALGQLRQSPVDWRLTAVGDGPLLGAWKALAASLGIGERCTFPGKVSRAEVLRVMATGHCFVQPSLYDATSSVVAEALAHGLPVLCLDHFGFKDAVQADCGVKISPDSFPQVVSDFASAIEALWLDEDRRYAMAIAAQIASQQLTWEHKAEVINKVYRRVLPEMFSAQEHPDKLDASAYMRYELNTPSQLATCRTIENQGENVR
jgi:glycosyltransferase involved in cell wall biosynthesis